jgi:hypothetical protein
MRTGYGTVSTRTEHVMTAWKDAARGSIRDLLSDPVLRIMLERSSLTRAQFETFLLDQMGSEIAEKRLNRHEMALLRRDRGGISRGSFNRTLKQGRTNVSESIHTMLLLGYCGLLESPGLAPFVEASDRLRTQLEELRKSTGSDKALFDQTVMQMLHDLEQAYHALMGWDRDV